MLTRQSRALLSWQIDVVTSVAVLALLYGWIADLRSNRANYISESFFHNGFCLSPLFESTHMTCSMFDGFGGGAFIGVAILSSPKIRNYLLPMAAYLFSHAYGHYVGGTELVEPGSMDDDKAMPLKDLIALAAILSIGPFGGVRYLVEAGKIGKGMANAIAAAALVVLVGIFVAYVRKPRFALLYINITILLTVALPKVFAIGYKSEKDVALRADMPLWYLNTAAGIFVATIVFAEPFYCDSFVASIGGHLLFDISLMLQAVVHAVIHAKSESSEGKQKVL